MLDQMSFVNTWNKEGMDENILDQV